MQTRTKQIIRLALITVLLLSIPLIAMQFSEEAQWTLSDFVFAGVLIFGTGLAYELVAKRMRAAAYRAAVGLALAGGFLLIWINGAVGIIGNEDNPANLMYFVVIFIGVIGAIISRLRPRGLSRTMFVMAIAQLLVPVIALIMAPSPVPFSAGVVGVFMLSAFFAVLFLLSGTLFEQVAQQQIKEQYAA